MKIKNLILPCLLCMVMYSCSDKEELEVENNEKCQVFFSIDDFAPESLTRTNCDPNNSYRITWASEDIIGVFPREGDQEPFVIPTEQIGQSQAVFDGGYWALKTGKTYNAYYPFSRENYASSDMKTKISVTYLGQYQNGQECNVGAFDYTYSDWKESVGSASVSFSFHHLGSFLVINLPIPANATYTTLTLNAGNSVIPTSGTYDLTAMAPAFVAKTKAPSLSMQLNGFTGVEGENATFYMMVPPMDLSGETLSVTLSSGTTSYSYSIESKNILAARLYKLTGTPLPSINLHNGHEYVDLGVVVNGKTVYWATTNIGAERPSDYGLYFAWGEIEGYTEDVNDNRIFDWANYSSQLCGGSENKMKKYCTSSTYGSVDNKTVLDPQDDAARMIWQGQWRMPTYEEQTRLRTQCYWKWVTNYNNTNTKGFVVYKAKSDSDKGKFSYNNPNLSSSYSESQDAHIFLPASGYRVGSQLRYREEDIHGVYWSSSLNELRPQYAFTLCLWPEEVDWNTGNRGLGFSVRPVFQ